MDNDFIEETKNRFSNFTATVNPLAPNEVYYVESAFNEELNRLIRSNFSFISNLLARKNMAFVYVPLSLPDDDTLAYLYPKASTDLGLSFADKLQSASSVQFTATMLGELGLDGVTLNGGLFRYVIFSSGENIFSYCDLSGGLEEDVFRGVIECYASLLGTGGGKKFFALPKSDSSVVLPDEFRIPLSPAEQVEREGKSNQLSDKLFDDDIALPPPNDADSNDFGEQEATLMANRIASQIKQLKSRGYYDLLLKAVAPELALKYDKPVMQCSRLQVSDRFAFLLPDWEVPGEEADNRAELKLTPICKALYILFLRHPEGLVFKCLSAQREELLAIYSTVTNRSDLTSIRQSVDRLIDPTDNAINEKVSRIKEAFLKICTHEIVHFYAITKMHNDDSWDLKKHIELPRQLVSLPPSINAIPLTSAESYEQAKQDCDKYDKMIARIDRNIQSGKWSCKKSAEMLSDIIGFDHTIYNAYFQRARLYIQIHDYQKAISDDSLLLDRNEHLWSDCLLDRAECFFQLGRLHEALHDLDRYAFHRVPDKNKVYLELRHKTEEALAKI
jgi:hypothetical protein